MDDKIKKHLFYPAVTTEENKEMEKLSSVSRRDKVTNKDQLEYEPLNRGSSKVLTMTTMSS